ncbi:SusC/RagA family TonB-linked outer membrane protein [Mucilaginibacter sp.]|jgi:TonB-linked SusC/RagA family outer membrane protein|uniref:SusC/RagA family TonB-linked outer membrane protein n=1 Tax=Mucilaginibacter sp. TaxID=1882438 RepID=UPI0035692589
MKKNLLNRQLILSLFILLALTSIYNYAGALPQVQIIKADVPIKGKVIDEEGKTLPGVSIILKGTTKGTVTDVNGNFTIVVNDKINSTIVITYVGYQRQEIKLNGQDNLTIQLKLASIALNEVVTIGYGTINRRDLTGAVSSVSANDLKDIPVSSATEALTGRIAGVKVTTSEGAPGASANIVIRGGGSITQDNSPLYIIDGVQVESGLDGLSPQDIESVDVLKDAASTAIYGARGANGVIIVTTKSGRNMKTAVNYNGFIGISQIAKTLNVMDPYNFVEYQYERSRGNPGDELSFANTYGKTWDTLAVYKNTPPINWQEKMFGKNAVQQTHNFSITGGTKTTTFNLSLTKNIQDAIMLNSSFDRNAINFKFDHQANSKLRTGITVRYSDQDILGSGTSAGGVTQSSRLRQTIRYKPLNLSKTLGDDDFDPAYYTETNALGNGAFLINPVALNSAEYRKNSTMGFNLGAYLNYNITPFLSFRSTGSFAYSTVGADSFDDINTPAALGRGNNLPMVGVINTDVKTTNFSNVLTFTNASLKSSFNKKNSVTVLVGQELYGVNTRQSNIQLRQFPIGITSDKAIGQLNLGTIFPGYPTSLLAENKTASFFTRANYAFKQKYLASFTLRADGSTKFAADNRWGYFPSGSLGWRISQEKFMEKMPFISDLKLRLSYGESGNNRIGDFLYSSNFVTTAYPYGLNGVMQQSYFVSKLANPELRWETTTSKNIGLDFGFLQNRFLLTVDAYQNDVRDLLIPVPISPTSGYANQLQNVGNTQNRGIEFQVIARIINNKSFKWNTNLNIAFNRNKITALSSNLNYYTQNSGWGISGQLADYIVKVGAPVGSMYGFMTDGYYQLTDFNYDPATKIYSLKTGVPTNIDVAGVPQPGSIKFKDLDGDGKVDSKNDRTIIGNANPKFTGGINQQFAYKNFDLSVFMNFVYGNSILNANKIEFTNAFVRSNNMLDMMTNRWRTIDNNGNVIQSTTTVGGKQVAIGESPDVLAAVNQGANIWQPLKGSGAYTLSSWAVEDGSFLRINNITLGYTFNVKLLSKIGIQKLRFYTTLNNVAIITNYSGFDPEVNVANGSPVTPGLDYSAYPRSKSYIFGLNLTL